MKIHWGLEIPHLAILAAMAGAAVFGVVQWSWQAAALVFYFAMALLVYPFFLIMPRIDPGRANYSRFSASYWLFRLSILGLIAALFAETIVTLAGFDIGRTSDRVISLYLIIVGNLLGKVRPNWMFGIRNRWTLSSKRAWDSTNRLGGWLVSTAGLVLLLTTWLPWGSAFGLALIGSLLLVPPILLVNSYRQWRDDVEKVAPAATLPAEEGSTIQRLPVS